MKHHRLILLALLLLCGRPMGLAAQQDWTWTFGDGVIMRFPGGGGPVVDPINQTSNMLETVSCISDSAGNLIYYANNAFIHKSDGSHPAGNYNVDTDDITNGVILLPVWGQADAYLMPVVNGGACTAVSYCPIMSTIEQIGGIDTVTAYRNLGQYHPLNPLSEKVAAVRDAQGTGWWLIYHGGYDNNFIRFKVDGKQALPLSLQSIGSPYTTVGANPYWIIGEVCFSPQGDRLLAVNYTGVVDLFDFDRCTGQLSNWRALGTPAPNVFGPNTFYGCSFSPDGSKVYASEEGRYNGGNRAFQWDLNAPDIVASKTLIYTGPDSVEFGQHQLGPDGKIYIALYPYTIPNDTSQFYLSVIHDPNQPGTACNFSYAGLWLQGRRSTLSLPNLPNFNLPPLVRQVAEAGPPRLICPGDSVLIGYPDSTGGAVAYAWTGPGISTPTSATTWVRPAADTWYYLTATDPAMGACGVTLDSVLVRVADSADFPLALAGGDTAVCAGGQALLVGAPVPGLVYTWTPATGLHTPDSSATVADSAGTFVLSVTNPLGTGVCFIARDTVRIVAPPASGFAGPDTLLCRGDSARIGTTLPPGWAALWTPADGLADPSALPAMAAPYVTTSYVLSVSDTLAAGACATASDTLLVTVEEPFDHPAPLDITYCPGEALRVGVEALPGHTYAWTPSAGLQDPTASTTLVAPPPGGAAYMLTVTRLDLLSDCRERAFAVLLTDGGCLLQNVLTPNGDGVNDKLVLGPFAGSATLSIFDRWGARVFHADAYGDDWDADGLPDGVYYYVLLVDGRRVAEHVTVLR